MDGGGEAAVHAKDLIVDYHTKSEEVEHVSEIVPDVGIAVFPSAFGVEAIGLGDASRFVVPADKMDALRIAELEADKERYCFDAEKTSVDIVAWIMKSAS